MSDKTFLTILITAVLTCVITLIVTAIRLDTKKYEIYKKVTGNPHSLTQREFLVIQDQIIYQH